MHTNVRLFIYFVIATGTAFTQSSEGMNVAGMSPFEWGRFWVSVAVQGLIAIKAYLDPTWANQLYDDKKKAKQNEAATVPQPQS